MSTSNGGQIKFRCDHCQKTQRAPEHLAGRVGKCSACQGRFRVPGEAIVAKAVEPVAFAHSYGAKEDRSTCVLVVERDALRVIECKGLEAVAECLVTNPRAFIETVAAVATSDARVTFSRVRRVEKDYHGGLDLEYGKSSPKSLHVSLGDEVADLALKHLGQALKGFEAGERAVSLAKAVCFPALLAVCVGLLGWFLHATAAALQENAIAARGKAALVSALISAVGPTAFAVITGVIVGLALLTIASRVLTPPTVPVLSRV